MAWMIPRGDMRGDHHMFMEDGYDGSEDNVKTKGRKRKKLLFKTVRETMEFYFSDANLSKDRFLRQLVEEDPYVPLETFLKFNKIVSLVSTVEEIVKAVKKSDILELSEDCLKVRRKTEVKVRENEDDCTIYVENLPPEITHDELTRVFSEFGKVVYVSIPKHRNTRAPKGFAFIEFETPEDAAETIHIFMEKGSCLSPHMLPDKLCSIRSFENEKSTESHKPLTVKDGETKCKSSGDKSSDQEDQMELDSTILNEDKSGIKSSKKRKHDCNSEEPDGEPTMKKEKKNEKSCTKKDIEISENDEKEEEINEKDAKEETEIKTENETSENDSCQDEKNGEPSHEKKKKKNRKKKKRHKELELFANGMVVLSKKEWKHLRNKYLNMQRVNMRRVKQQVLEARFLRRPPYMPHPGLDNWRDEEMRPPPPPVDAPKPRVTFTPGVIVCVKFKEPMVDIKAFKAEARTQPGVQYVDVHEGVMEAYLRCSGPLDAQHLLQLKFWKDMSILSGTDESSYWDKIAKDREDKLGKKVRVTKERGKRKLLKKAEIVKATHLHFDN